MTARILLLSLLGATGCSVFAPSASEGEGVGSNTNWFRACDTSMECGSDLSCMCGACTKACTEAEDCEGLSGAACPVDSGIYRVLCESEGTADGAVSTAQDRAGVCMPVCASDSDCGSGQFCAAGSCLLVAADPCPEAAQLELEATSSVLRARVGGLFGDQYYVPTWYASYPTDWLESYTPSVLSARITDEDGEPVEGCQVTWFTGEESGSAFAAQSASDAEGLVNALWVAGSAEAQTLQAAIVGRDGALTASLSGTAIRHEEEPLSDGPEGRNFTSPSGISFRIEEQQRSDAALVEVTPLTFPAGVTYSIFRSALLSLRLSNDGPFDPVTQEVPADDRTLKLDVYAEESQTAQAISLSTGTSCTFDSSGTYCVRRDSWTPGEALRLSLEARALGFGEVPAEYAPQTHAMDPCASSIGCTDFSISLSRAGGDFEVIAVLRAGGDDGLLTHSGGISGVYTEEQGTAPSCLQTPKASLLLRHEMSFEGVVGTAGSGFFTSSHETWQNQICSNYSLLSAAQGWYLSTGGPTATPTPVLPGEELPF